MEELIKLIKAFLDGGKKTAFEGWPEVTLNELDELNIIISGLIKLKYDVDFDGDLPLSFIIINKEQEQELYPAVVPHRHDKPGMDHKLVQRLSMGLSNLSAALTNEVTIEMFKDKEKKE